MNELDGIAKLAESPANPELAAEIRRALASGVSIFTILLLLTKFKDILDLLQELRKARGG